jgi:hypothetical protein
VGGYPRIKDGLPVLFEGRKGTLLVGSHQARITNYVSREDSCKLPVYAFYRHGALSRVLRDVVRAGMLTSHCGN